MADVDKVKEKIQQRCKQDGVVANIDMVTEDLYYLSRPSGSHVFSKL